MTREAFITGYLKRSRMTREEGDRDLVALPCYCEEPGCKGWQMLVRDGITHRDCFREEPALAILFPKDIPKP